MIFLEGGADSFQNLGSKGQVFDKNPRANFQGMLTA